MNSFKIKPYKLFNKIQNYEWGTKNEDAFIPKLLNLEIVPGRPYAELWIGTHPKAPSEVEVDNEKFPLDKLIQQFNKECLGEYVSKKFGNKFPFLLKVLSASTALSIQTHPNKMQAEKLHAKDPNNYPDDNHKPEIAIALDSLTAIAGFKPVSEIIENLKSMPELKELAGNEIIDRIFIEKENQENLIKKFYSIIMTRADDAGALSQCIIKILQRLKTKNNLAVEETQFLKQHEIYGDDVGLLSFFFLNFIELEPGQAIFTDAGVPHAYIKGNIIECMANSDNVVRAGLTNKFKDIGTLLEIIKYDFSCINIINKEQKCGGIIYKTAAQEFEVSSFEKTEIPETEINSHDRPSVILIIEGSMKLSWNENGKKNNSTFIQGDSIFIPASLHSYKIISEKFVKYFTVNIP